MAIDQHAWVKELRAELAEAQREREALRTKVCMCCDQSQPCQDGCGCKREPPTAPAEKET